MAITLSILDGFAKFFHYYKEHYTHHTLSMLLHYLGKLKNQKYIVLLMHVKHVSNATFYHLSNR